MSNASVPTQVEFTRHEITVEKPPRGMMSQTLGVALGEGTRGDCGQAFMSEQAKVSLGMKL